jgi:hypothetical protein
MLMKYPCLKIAQAFVKIDWIFHTAINTAESDMNVLAGEISS